MYDVSVQCKPSAASEVLLVIIYTERARARAYLAAGHTQYAIDKRLPALVFWKIQFYTQQIYDQKHRAPSGSYQEFIVIRLQLFTPTHTPTGGTPRAHRQ